MWTLISKGIAYKMEGSEYVESKLLEKRPDGSLILKTPSGNYVWNDNASVPAKKASKPKDRLVKVPYWKQTDNYRDANRTCFSSSMAMMIEFLLPDELPDDDTYVKTVFSIGDTTDYNTQIIAALKHGVRATYSQSMDFDILDSELANNYPIGIGILHRGPLASPTGGHWLVCTGISNDGSKYRFNDPYGSLMDGYQGEVENGKDVWYSKDVLRARWTVGSPNTGWGMTVRKAD